MTRYLPKIELSAPGHFFLIFLCSFCLLSFPIPANGFKLFRIGTGGKTGVYYPIGKLIASGITHEAQVKESALEGYIGVAQNSAGSIDNIRSVLSGDIEAGLVQADIADFAFNGKKNLVQEGRATALRAIASLYPEKFQLVVRNDAGITSFEELRGKRISVDELGSGTLAVMRIVLEAHNMTEQDLTPLYLKPVFTQEQMMNGQVQGFAMMAGAPMIAVTKLLETGITLVPIDLAVASSISRKYPYLTPGKIDAGLYPGIPETSTLEVYALIVVHEDLPEETAYAITDALFSEETLRLLSNGHPQGGSIDLKSALKGISIPLHPGAKRYYMQQGVYQ